MQYTEQPTPPFNSPYQTHASREDTLLDTPYLSPSRHDPMSRYQQGLGLYSYHHQSTLPPSPSPSEPWSGHVSTGASPLMTQAIADPYASGAFDHPIIRSPQPWDSSQLSPRSPVSSATMVPPVHSHTESDSGYHDMSRGMATVNLQGHSWGHDVRYAHNGVTAPSSQHPPLTVAPDRLNSNIVPYGNPYAATQIPRMESTPAPKYDDQLYLRASRKRVGLSRPKYPQAPAHKARMRSRRHTNPATAAFVCPLCKDPQKGFARHYNFKQHMETHKADRARPHICPYEECQKAFVRNADLKRHHISIHNKERDFKCTKCPAMFSRKDTCKRHTEDGCNQRARVSSSEAMEAHYRQNGYYSANL